MLYYMQTVGTYNKKLLLWVLFKYRCLLVVPPALWVFISFSLNSTCRQAKNYYCYDHGIKVYSVSIATIHLYKANNNNLANTYILYECLTVCSCNELRIQINFSTTTAIISNSCFTEQNICTSNKQYSNKHKHQQVQAAAVSTYSSS